MRRAVMVKLTDEERRELGVLIRAGTTPQRFARRARVVLLADKGDTNEEIAQVVGMGLSAVGKWRRRFAECRMAGILRDRPGRGRKATISKEKIADVVRRTTTETPRGRTHWSRASMAVASGLSESTIGRIWREHGLAPHRLESIKLSKDKDFVAKVEDVVGLHLSPPENAAVFCIDEKSQIQARDRSQLGLPIK